MSANTGPKSTFRGQFYPLNHIAIRTIRPEGNPEELRHHSLMQINFKRGFWNQVRLFKTDCS